MEKYFESEGPELEEEEEDREEIIEFEREMSKKYPPIDIEHIRDRD